jgi:excinuclease ABC subunit C
MSEFANAPLAGSDLIRDFVTRLPGKPGVYRMYDAKGDVIYVGKAHNLRHRVSSYARGQGHNNRIALMISLTANMEFVVTATEVEALLLESNLIKKLKPRFNVILRDDKSFPYILVARDHPAPQLVKHRGARNRKGSYFGPFASAGAVNQAINTLQKAFLLRTCTDSFFENRTRPCLLHQIKRCAAPCVGLISESDYNELAREAERFLETGGGPVKAELAARMEAASKALDFEQAARYRDRIQAMSFVTQSQGINPQGVDEADVFGIAQDGGITCVQVFFFRAGQNWGNRAYFPRSDKSLSQSEILAAFIGQFYDDRPLPKLVLLSEAIAEQELHAQAFTAHAGYKVEVLSPQRGERKTLTAHAVTNAREAAGRKLAESASQSQLLEGVAKAFGLEQPPARIEIYDNSHVQGAHAVGAMVVAGPDGFVKSQYRKFNMKQEPTGDDFGMMREMLTRRFTRLLDESGSSAAEGQWPDLLLIDGGQGQMSAVLKVLEELGVTDVPVVGVSKGRDRDAGREHFHVPGRASFMLEARDPVLYYVQRLRDEAHRFAVGSHRAKRTRAIGVNPLDDIAGIGPARKKALLQSFGSAKAVARAGVGDLAAVDGVSKQLAQSIYDYFHPDGA